MDDTLKNEMPLGGSLTIEADARIEIFDFVEFCYNHHRKQAALRYQTPTQFEVGTQTKIKQNLVQKSLAPQSNRRRANGGNFKNSLIAG